MVMAIIQMNCVYTIKKYVKFIKKMREIMKLAFIIFVHNVKRNGQ